METKVGKSLPDRMKDMLDNQLMCDITFNVGPNKSPTKAHMYMLASASPVFYSMFDGPLAEKGVVDIPDIRYEDFSLILQYIYTDTIALDFENVGGVVYGSEKYMLQSLKDQCSKFLSTNIDIEHACTVFQTAYDFQMKELEEEALNFILKKGRGCLESFDFLHLSAECLQLIVHSDKLVCEEENVFERMILWAKQRCEEQSIMTTDHNIRQSLGDLLYLIRFPCMEPKFFMDKVSSKSILTLEEIDEVYEHFNDKQTDIFSSKCRLSKIVRVQRCKVDTSTIWGYYGEDDHCVDFQTSNDAELTSVLLFGSETYSGSSEITINILHGCSVLSTKQTKINFIPGQEIYEIWLEPSVYIVAHNRYTIHLNMNGPATFRGKEYVQKVTNGGDFVVTFLRPLLTSGKNTNETRGQIPGLVFQV